MRATFFVPILLTLAAVATAGETVVEGELGRKLDSVVQRTTGGGYWGAVLVARDGKPVLAKGYGYADYAGRPNTPQTLFEIASTSKQVTAAAILRLVEKGKLRLDDPLAKHLPDVPDDKKAITIRQLLNHTSGMSPRIGVPYDSPIDRATHARQMLAKPLDSPPGTKFEYCNAAYAILAGLVEVASGESFEAFCKKELFARAGLEDTGFVGDPDLDRSRAAARLDGGRPDASAIDWHWGWGYRGMGGVVTTVDDMLAWDRALRKTKVLRRKSVKELYTPAMSGYALGWRVLPTGRGTTKVQHSGGVAGFVCQYIRYLEDDVVIVLLSNGKTNLHDVAKKIEETLFPRPAVTAVLDATPYELTEYRAIQLDGKGTSWKVASKGGPVLLTLHDDAKGHALARVHLPAGEARRLLASLEKYLRGRGAAEGNTEAGVYLMPYRDRKRIELTEDVVIDVMPRYSGRGEDGKPIVDPRITLFLMDRPRRFWPLMVKMSDAMAHRLAKDLAQASR
jgi:CubicO group peptidase (beta-lactamase class C family)